MPVGEVAINSFNGGETNNEEDVKGLEGFPTTTSIDCVSSFASTTSGTSPILEPFHLPKVLNCAAATQGGRKDTVNIQINDLTVI